MVVTLDGIVTLERLLQFWNAEAPMLILPEPAANVTPVRPVQPLNALAPMPVTLAGITTSPVILLQSENAESPMLKLSEVLGNVKPARRLQPENALAPMFVILVPERSPLVRRLQPENAEAPMLVRLAGNSTLVRLLQP